MTPASFTAILAAVVAGAGLVGWGTVFLSTREEGFYRGYAWRVHLADLGRAWTAQILAPGRGWENTGKIPVATGRQVAIDMALDAIDVR